MFLIVHGGAAKRKPRKSTLKKIHESLSAGYKILQDGGAALDAVVTAIEVLENSGIFNAGAGGWMQLDGIRRLDASLMDGEYLKAGSVIGIEGIKNPIRAARFVMDSPHVILTNTGAGRIASMNKLSRLPEANKRVLRTLMLARTGKGVVAELYKKYFSTVGAVAVDGRRNCAAGASTGGVLAMLPGRVGDTPIIGAGVYAENRSGAVSCTGRGEAIIRLSLAKEITMNLKAMSPLKAVRHSFRRLSSIEGEAGVIVINSRNQFAIVHTTEYMPSGYADRSGIVVKDKFS